MYNMYQDQQEQLSLLSSQVNKMYKEKFTTSASDGMRLLPKPLNTRKEVIELNYKISDDKNRAALVSMNKMTLNSVFPLFTAGL